jgi:ribosome-binding protein aMBF1 (putative translation factor)
MKLTDLVPLDEVISEHRSDPGFRREWDRGGFAREVAARIVRYRSDHALTQSRLAGIIGTTQSVVARLEAGEHGPSLQTLAKVSAATGIEFRLDISHGEVALI